MVDETYADYKRFTLERIREVVDEGVQSVDECVRLIDMLVDDAEESGSSKNVDAAKKLQLRIRAAADKAREALNAIG